MRKTHSLVIRVLTVIFVSSVPLLVPPVTGFAGTAPLVWSPVNIPQEGSAGNWQLAAGSDIKRVAVAKDGTLFATVNTTATNSTIFKSLDNGITWNSVGNVSSLVTGLAISGGDPSRVYYAADNRVFRSTDGGVTFTTINGSPGGSGAENIVISCLTVTRVNNDYIIAVGTTDSDAGQFGGVYTINESNIMAGWVDTSLESIDVLSVAFSPRYEVDRQMIAAGSVENGTVISFRRGNEPWSKSYGNATINSIVSGDCVLSLPGDYDRDFFLGIDSGNGTGDAYRIIRSTSPNASIAIDLNVGASIGLTGLDISGLAVGGTAGGYILIAGAAQNARVFHSEDSGQTWAGSVKSPTGEGHAVVAMTSDFTNSRRAYAGSTGAGSAFCVTDDGGGTWNGISLIDTKIEALIDLAISPAYNRDGTMFLLTWGGEQSLWRSKNSGNSWERVYTCSLGNAASIIHVAACSQNRFQPLSVVLTGETLGATVWKSSDGGQTFTGRPAGFNIDAMAVAGPDEYFFAAYNGSNGLVYRTTDGGISYSAPAIVGAQPINRLTLSPGFSQDRNVLAGNTNGWVFLSNDGGKNFQSIPDEVGSPPLTAEISPAFDWQYSVTKTIYAASNNASTAASRSRLYRYTVGKSQQWEQMDATLPVGGRLGQICILPGGSLYAANSRDNGGVERSLNPAAAAYPTFETVSVGLGDKCDLNGLWGSGNQLWSLDTRNNRLMTYIDTLVAPVVPGNPYAGAGGLDTKNCTLDWNPLEGATLYEWQADNDGSFSGGTDMLKGETTATSVKLPRLDPASTYFWRVRAKYPTLSPWSPVRQFYTVLGNGTPKLIAPVQSGVNVPLNPLFQWETIDGAEKYEIIVANSTAFTNPVISLVGNNALIGNVWQCDITLGYNTTYYWKIRGISSTSFSFWSGIGVFKTIPPLAAPVQPLAGKKVTLVSPPDKEIEVGLQPVFEWSPVAAADRYELLVSSNLSFTNAEIAKIGLNSVNGTIWQSDIQLEPGKKYFWRVRGSDGKDFTAWSDVYSFTTILPKIKLPIPLNVEPVYPKTGAEGIPVVPVFQWKVADGAEKYEVIAADNNLLKNPVIDKTGKNIVTGEVWQSDVTLAFNTTYYWRVRAVADGDVSVWSEINAFRTEFPPLSVVPTLELENPAPGAEGVSVTPIFQWKPVNGADRYELLVSNQSDFTSPVVLKTGGDSLTITAWRCDKPLADNTTYYWKVRAVGSSNLSVWSGIAAFRTVAGAAPVEVKTYVENPLDGVVLNYPVGSIRTGVTPRFTWNPVSNAERYELLISRDAAFSNPEIIRSGAWALPDTSWQSEYDLENDITYYWKVRAVAGNRTSEWSSPGVFVTEPDSPILSPVPAPVMPEWAVYAGGTLAALVLMMGTALTVTITRNKRP